MTNTELVIELLKKVQRNFPNNLWIWAADGQLYLMRKGENNEHSVTKQGGVDRNYIVETIGIEADGGDW